MDKLYALAKKAYLRNVSLDELFRRERPDLFREIEGKPVLATENKPVKCYSETDNQQRRNTIR